MMRQPEVNPIRFGVLIPSTNTIVEADFQYFDIPNTTWHFSRVAISNESLDSDNSFLGFLDLLRDEIDPAMARLLTCQPDYLVMGMSAETFWGGQGGNLEFEERLRRKAGLDVFTGASACGEALSIRGSRRVSILTPYQAVGDDQVRSYFQDIGCEIEEVRGLRCESATSIARVSPADVAKNLLDLAASSDVDSVVQVGTNLRGAEVAPVVERLSGKPIVAVNTAIAWHATRSTGGTTVGARGGGELFEL